MFKFTPEDLPAQQLAVELAEIEIYAFSPLPEGKISLYVNIKAEGVELPDPEDPDFSHTVKPRFYTEWLDIPVAALRSKSLDCLDGYQMQYDQDSQEELGFDQPPGAIYDRMHAVFTHAEMTLSHIEGGRYKLHAHGETEFGWRFNIQTEAVLRKISFRAQDDEEMA